ncbi:MAG: TolC family protein [Deltaproteobacteria bacterium]|nr:TolC family protein [Deltaproteobacteria bacterium]
MPRPLTFGLVALALAFGLLSPHPAPLQAADDNPGQSRRVTFREYLEAVATYSLDLKSQRQNITSAQADISIAGVRPDPELRFGIDSAELYEPNKPNASLATVIELGYTLETAGKRDKRIQVAESKLRLAEANVAAFLHQLGLDSASAFIEACRTRDALARKQSSLQSFQELVRATEIRYRAGDVSKLELWQTNVEADRFTNEVTSARAEAQAAEITLTAFLGKPFEEVFPGAVVDTAFKGAALEVNLATLIQQALKKRYDIQVAAAEVENARQGVQLAKANRWLDPKINLSLTNTPRVDPLFNHEGQVTNAPAERSLELGLTVTVPLPFSRLQKGELVQAEVALSQAHYRLSSMRLKAETEVRATFAKYRAACENVRHYREHVLQDSDRVTEGMRLAYRMGSASFLELLNAQRTADETYLGYLQAVADLANATVKLQISAGMGPDL